MDRRHLITLLALVLAGAGASYLLKKSVPLGRYVGDSPSAMQVLQETTWPQVESGAADLPVVVFTDYRCPACRKADPALRAAVVADGNVRLIYRDWPVFGPRSERAAEIALAAHYQGIYPQVHHAFMNAPNLDERNMREIVEKAGGDWGALRADLQRHNSQIVSRLAENSRQAMSLGVPGTPSYLIGPLLVEGALSEEEFRRAFEQARAELRSKA